MPSAFHRHLWACPSRTPLFYPDAVTLDGAATEEDVLAHVESGSPGCSVKDSFANLDLRDAGFRVLFDATWIARVATKETASTPPSNWSTVDDAVALDQWRRAADRDLPDALLGRDDVVVLAGHATGGADDVCAGAVLNQSGSVVGLGNVFSAGRDLEAVWSACVALAADRFPGMPLVGYEAGAPLAAAHRQGFDTIGELRVWIEDSDLSPTAS